MNRADDLNARAQAPGASLLEAALLVSGALHHHVCPRQVLGARIGFFGLRQLGLIDGYTLPLYANDDKRLHVLVETDGCGADGISAATNAWVGRRTMRVFDYGKLAATFVDTATGQALRVAPRPASRDLAPDYAPQAASRWHAYLEGYRLVPDALLLAAEPVTLTIDLVALISRPGARAICDRCGEEIMNEREQRVGERTLCRWCAGGGYYVL